MLIDPDIVIHAAHPQGGALCMGEPLPIQTLMISFAGVNCEACNPQIGHKRLSEYAAEQQNNDMLS